jgi:hypothetical protein
MRKGGRALLLAALFGLGTVWGLAPVGSGIALARDRTEGADPDTDGDGLSDSHETHKYRTDPKKKDTAGRGVPDGDWQQRREFTYSVRAVLRVMPPYNLQALTDDYQDVRVRKETKEFVELEVVAYPLNTNAEAIKGNPNWKKDYAGMKEYLAPGITTNWDNAMRQDLLRELAKDGIDPDKLTDQEVVERVARWLFKRSTYRNMFPVFGAFLLPLLFSPASRVSSIAVRFSAGRALPCRRTHTCRKGSRWPRRSLGRSSGRSGSSPPTG